MNDLVARLHEGLVEALRRRQQSLAQPVTVAEIYQDLIPYRLVRSEFGFALNADYEHALLQLLAGEGNYVRIEPPEARAELRKELNTSNPNVAMIRHYAACDVFVSGPATAATPGTPAAKVSERRREPAPKPATPPAPAAGWESSLITGKPVEPAEAPATSARAPASPRKPEPAPKPAAPAPKAPAARTESAAPKPAAATPAVATNRSCASCGKVLPARPNARFCPFCGTDQTGRICVSCHAQLEPGWRFCVNCGAASS